MHSAPSVTYPVGRSHLAAAFFWAFWLGAAGLVGLWTAQAGSAGWRQALAALVLGVAVIWAFIDRRTTAAGELSWDGQQWSHTGAAGSGTLVVALDLQSVLLVQWRDGRRGGAWLWLERSRLPERWNALRRAVYSRAIPDALQGAEPPAAKP